jgi:Ca2+-binding EF-hand superfamily protein
MYYLHEAVDQRCFNKSYITWEHLNDPSRSHGDKYGHCVFFDYNPQTRMCCIPSKDEPVVDSFNRYTINTKTLKAALNFTDHHHDRRLGGGGGTRQDWLSALMYVKIKDEEHPSKCAGPPLPESAHPHIFTVGATLNLFEFSSCLFFLILFTIFLELIVEKIEHYCRNLGNDRFMDIFNKITSELMILGIISFTIFFCEVEMDLASQPFYIELELAHLMLFFIGIVFALQSVHLLTMMRWVIQFWGSINERSALELVVKCDQAVAGKLSFLEKISLAEMVRFHVVKNEFLTNHTLPNDFPFVAYLNKYFIKLIVHTVHIDFKYWIFVCAAIWVNWARSALLDMILRPYYVTHLDGVAPYESNEPYGATESPNQDPFDFPHWGYWYFIALGYIVLTYAMILWHWCGPNSVNQFVNEVLLLIPTDDGSPRLLRGYFDFTAYKLALQVMQNEDELYEKLRSKMSRRVANMGSSEWVKMHHQKYLDAKELRLHIKHHKKINGSVHSQCGDGNVSFLIKEMGRMVSRVKQELERFQSAPLARVLHPDRLNKMQTHLSLLLLFNIFYLTTAISFYLKIAPPYYTSIAAVANVLSMLLATPMAAKNFFFLCAISMDDDSILEEVKSEEQDGMLSLQQLAVHIEMRCTMEDLTPKIVFDEFADCLNLKSRMKNLTSSIVNMDKKNTISSAELKKSVKKAGMPMSKARLQNLMNAFDRNRDHLITYQEFIVGLAMFLSPKFREAHAVQNHVPDSFQEWCQTPEQKYMSEHPGEGAMPSTITYDDDGHVPLQFNIISVPEVVPPSQQAWEQESSLQPVEADCEDKRIFV